MFKQFEDMTSEEKLGISDAPDYQCSNISAMIKELNDAKAICEACILAIDPQTHLQALKETFYRIKNAEERLEEFRSEIEGVREWGNEWKTLAKLKINKHEPNLLTKPTPECESDIPF